MIVDDIALTMQPRIGPATAAHLMACFGTAERLYAASHHQLTHIARLSDSVAAAIVSKPCHKQAEKEVAFCARNGITPIASTSELYPPLLRECNDYPHVIYYKGDTAALQGRMLSMVGTRRVTQYGLKMCQRLVGDLARMFPDLVIVSGLAFGVDGACHRAALAAGVATIGVLPNPLTSVYPAQHATLAQEMVRRGGGILSEYHSQTKTKGVTFVPRNRIVAGMSMGTVVVESPLKSGSRITAGFADGYDRCVMAVPGRAGDEASEGCNLLIRTQKARLVCTAEDVAAELMWEMPAAEKREEQAAAGLSGDAAAIYGLIPAEGGVTADELALMSGLTVGQLAPLLLELQFEGMVTPLPGNMFERG